MCTGLPQGILRVRCDNSYLAWGYPPFLGRNTRERSGVARETRWRRAGRVPESGRTDQGESRRGGVPSAENAICAESPAGEESRGVHGRTCRRGKVVLHGRDCRRCGHSLAGVGIWTMITVINCTA